VNNNRSKKFWGGRAARSITCGLLAAFAVLAVSGIASAQDKKDEITFNLLPNPAVVDCLRANPYEEPRARATVIRGKLNDTLILDLDGIKPGVLKKSTEPGTFSGDLGARSASPRQVRGSSRRGGYGSSTQPNRGTATINVTAQSGTIFHTTTVSVTVQ